MGGIHFGAHPTAPVSIRITAARPALPFAAVPASWKLGLMLLIVVTTAVIPVTWFYWHLSVGIFLLLLVSIGRIPLKPLLLRLTLIAPFLLGVCLASALAPQTGPGWRGLALRGALCVTTVTVFAAITPLSALPALLRRLKVPALLVTTLTLMHRYLYVLLDESQRMSRARASRTLRTKKAFTWAFSADLVGRLFVRASERAERIYLAMCSRGWK